VIAAGNPQIAAAGLFGRHRRSMPGLYAAEETTGRQAADFLQDHAVQARM
jgi:hypothetical protein